MRYHPRKQFKFKKPSLTIQSAAAETKIENIIEQFQATGLMPHSKRPPVYGNSPKLDFTDEQYAIANAKSNFESLPRDVRERFGSPVAYLEHQIKELQGTLSDEQATLDLNPKGTDTQPSKGPKPSSEDASSVSDDEPQEPASTDA